MRDQKIINNIARKGSKYLIKLVRTGKITVEQYNRIQELRLEKQIIIK